MASLGHELELPYFLYHNQMFKLMFYQMLLGSMIFQHNAFAVWNHFSCGYFWSVVTYLKIAQLVLICVKGLLFWLFYLLQAIMNIVSGDSWNDIYILFHAAGWVGFLLAYIFVYDLKLYYCVSICTKDRDMRNSFFSHVRWWDLKFCTKHLRCYPNCKTDTFPNWWSSFIFHGGILSGSNHL